ncbi:MAG: inosine/xanthosine triphosphatase [Candidatus Diapherotrites archaeon]|nr:inosine/xanthosine triphosphatase [Candidatus Diapherotrites archaeon]
MLIAVGTTNPVKIEAVRSAVQKLWRDAEVKGISVDSGVSLQPKGNEEAIRGAINRAKEALNRLNADLAFGLEGTVVEINQRMFLCGWVAAVDRAGNIGLACTAKVELPKRVAEEIRKGGELGPIMDKIIGENDTKKKQGAVGILTNNLVTRKEAFEQAVLLALARFITPQHYSRC